MILDEVITEINRVTSLVQRMQGLH